MGPELGIVSPLRQTHFCGMYLIRAKKKKKKKASLMVIEQALGSNLDQSNTNLGFLNYLIGKMQYFIKLFSGINRIMHVKNLAQPDKHYGVQ